MKQKRPDPIDVLVGNNLRILRNKNKLSQVKIAEALGLTFQQVQKYEKGANRIGAGRLMRLAKILKVPITALFEGSVETDVLEAADQASILSLISDRTTLRLLQAFGKISDPAYRRTIVDLVEQATSSPLQKNKPVKSK